MAKKTNGTGSTAFVTSVTKLEALAQQMLAVMNTMGLASLTADERIHSNGKLRDDEPAAMTSVFDTMDAAPGVFESLTDKDGGTDDATIETAPARADLARSQQLAPFVSMMQTLTQRASDDVLASASAAKAVSVPAYAIGRVNAASNKTVRTALAPAMSFYGHPAQLHETRSTRKENAVKKAAKKSKASGATT